MEVGEKLAHHATTLACTFPPLQASFQEIIFEKFSIKDADCFMVLGVSTPVPMTWLLACGYRFKHE